MTYSLLTSTVVLFFFELVLLFVVPPLIANPYLSPEGGRKVRLGSDNFTWELSWWNRGRLLFLSAIILFFSLFIATVPQGCAWSFGEHSDDCVSLDNAFADLGVNKIKIFDRNLVITNTDLVPDKNDKYGEVSINLRGRDLRFADFSFSDLHRADFSFAKLQGVEMWSTQLQWSKFEEADLQNASFVNSKLRGVSFNNADLRNAEFSNVGLQETNFNFTNLRNAVFESVNIEQALFVFAVTDGAKLDGGLLEDSLFFGLPVKTGILVD